MNYTLKENEVFCCGRGGCGPCNTYESWRAYDTEISACGNYKTEKSEKVVISTCCNDSVFVWDTVKDEEVYP